VIGLPSKRREGPTPEVALSMNRCCMVASHHDTDDAKMSRPLISDPVARAASHGTGSAPRDGWAAVVPELSVADIRKSLSFWCDVLGFNVAYDRPDARFAYSLGDICK
jgi:catechol-2,3-dioxygenase